MGSDRHYPEEAPARHAQVGDFLIDRHPVTNADFQKFVDETGHVTFAEIPPDPADYPGMSATMMQPGSAVFVQPVGPVHSGNPGAWWKFVAGADWRHPEGPQSSIDDRRSHPVVHIAYADAQAYARWAGKTLPSETEWEYAARGGLEAREFAWGDELMPHGKAMANFWHGRFPWENTLADGYPRTSPVGAFPSNGYSLHDMIGNVWEWTADHYGRSGAPSGKTCCGTGREQTEDQSRSDGPLPHIPQKVIKGGSHLCAPNYCRRYRPAARYPQPVDSPTSHIGFRCVRRV